MRGRRGQARLARAMLLVASLLAASPFAAMAAPAASATDAGAAATGTVPTAGAAGDGVRARLRQPELLRGGFVQEKRLRGFRNPLRSRGAFLLLRSRGIAWDTREPFAASTVLTRERLLTTLPDGTSRVLLDADASPGMATVNALLMALVAGDLDALAPQFTIVETLLADGAWTLELRPRGEPLARVFERVELRGDRHVREVHIHETGGDTTAIVFEALAETPAATAAERARFD